MQQLWQASGLRDVDTRVIKVERTYSSFDDILESLLGSPSIKAVIAAFAPAQMEKLKDRLRQRLPVSGDGRITCSPSLGRTR